MLRIASADLRVDLINPAHEHGALGSRFCWGGYIWQVYDRSETPLVTGPEWPKPDPSPFNGQGLPEAFRHHTRNGRSLTWTGDRGVGLGIGDLARNSGGEVFVVHPCEWRITQTADLIRFVTSRVSEPHPYELEREVSLQHRTLLSQSRLTNHSTEVLVLEWFSHPFFALTDRLIKVELPPHTLLAENPGFILDGTALKMKRRFEHQKDGHMDYLQLTGDAPLVATIDHPMVTHVRYTTDFIPHECPIWANNVTFSIEPYRQLSLQPGETKAWSLRYEFGPMRG